MIFVSGANGHFAGAVIRSILQAGLEKSLVVGTRDVQSAFARELIGRGVTVRHSDFRDPSLMVKALAGVHKALFIPTYDSNDQRLQQNLNAIEAARAAGVGHIVYPSFLNVESQRVEHSRLVHFPTEQAIRASGLGFTILRHALYADILVGDLPHTLRGGVLRRSLGEARCAFVARNDLGVSAATILMRDEPSGRVYSETMDCTYSGAEIAELMTSVFGRPVRYEAVPAEQWPQFMTDNWGVPAELSKSTLGTMQAIAAGEFDQVTSDFREITGRSAMTMQEFLEAQRAELKDQVVTG